MNAKDFLNQKKVYVSVTVVSDKEMKDLNKKYLGRDYPTDVLSFEIGELQDDGAFYLGDIVVNKEQAQRQASSYDNDVEKEIAELVEHGMLHLLGVHHEEEK
ncbi:rRNA maturation RNase YbeY [candidate division WWE3 bacterium]|uniref:Endoribonuclease YbeY n=1 Tax=candidate division WWE3 bacterium TaxID=2053526 RepID=A0A7X9HT58_UNCKA|nr:rRNA maturation RNase YbeY [candidate division WWE3 bacterium]